jgi:hypothetical protein
MKTRLFALSLAVSLATVAGVANANTCIEGAAVGGVAGHGYADPAYVYAPPPVVYEPRPSPGISLFFNF